MTRHYSVYIALAVSLGLSRSAMGDTLASEAKVRQVETGLLPIAATTLSMPASGTPTISVEDEGVQA